MRVSSSNASARPPQRERGRLRVAALLDAGRAAFAAKGFEGATMTEIAAQAGASIGSLYQFFPTKELLAEAIMSSDTDELVAKLRTFEAAAPGWSPSEVADHLAPALVKFRTDHPAFAVLLETTGAPAELAAAAGRAVRERVRAILAAAAPGQPAARLDAAAAAVQQVMKSAVAVKALGGRIAPAALEELKVMLRLYLADRLS